MAADATRIDQGVSLIEQRLSPAAILLYGSVVTGGLRLDSDVDIAVLLGTGAVDPFELASLRTDVEAVIGRDVDLVVLDSASPIIAMEVVRHHRIIHNRRPDLLERFVVKTLGAYFD
ncbi:MAG: type VII toxin-antitoxin system MntA family adenylyltransferase antitoxin, partial [Candidatus Binatia bacterium]